MIYICKSNRVRRTYLGGKRIDQFYGKTNSVDGYYPEDWVASTTKANNIGSTLINEGLSLCEDGGYLLDHIVQDRERMLGLSQVLKHKGKPSILVKLLDAAERLVIQVHPTIDFAKKHFNSEFGKTECWYIVDADKDAFVYLGFKEGITKEEWVSCFETQNISKMLSMLHQFPVKAGDLWFVDGGIPHAIGGGCMMVELQEPTDLMVIPERKTARGNSISDEKMHGGLGFEKMFDCFHYGGMSFEEVKKQYYRHPIIVINQCCPIIDSTLTDKFAMDYYYINKNLTVSGNNTYSIAIVVSGNGIMKSKNRSNTIEKGSQIFISADETSIEFVCQDYLEVLICRPC